MSRKQKTVEMKDNQLLHVETPLGIVNIRTGLRDMHGCRVDSIEIIPNRYAGEPPVTLDGFSNSRLVEALAEVPA